MPKLGAFLPAAILAAGCVFVLNARSQDSVPLAAPLTGVLETVPGYEVRTQKLTDEERRIAGMTDYVARVYARDSIAAFTTFVSYYDRQTQGKTIHSPRNCLPGAGWEVMTAQTADVNFDGTVHRLNHYILKNKNALAVVYYWYQGRGRVVANEYEVKWNLLRDAAFAGHTEEALVRVVVPVPPSKDGPESAEAKQLFADANALGADISARLAREVERVLPKSGDL
jgi:EpsI family protein